MGTAWTENRTYKIGGKTRFRAPAHTGTTTGTPTGTRAAGDVGPYHAPRPLDVTALDLVEYDVVVPRPTVDGEVAGGLGLLFLPVRHE